MNQTAILLILGFCVTEALYNVFIRKTMNREGKSWTARVNTVTGIAGALAAILLFVFAYFSGGAQITPGWWWPIIVTGLLVGVIIFAEFKALSLEDASLVGPIAATTPAAVVVASFFILGEYPTFWGWIGINLLVIGTYVLNVQSFLEKKKASGGQINWRDWLAPFIMLSKSRYAFLGVPFAVFSLNFEAMAVRTANVAFASGCIFAIAALLNLAAGWRLEGPINRSVVAKLWNKELLLISILMFLSIIFANTAFRYSIVPYVGTLKRLQIPLTIILAYLVLGEKKSFRYRFLGGTIMMAVGAALIALG